MRNSNGSIIYLYKHNSNENLRSALYCVIKCVYTYGLRSERFFLAMKLIKSDIYNVTKKYRFQINAVLFNFLLICES